MPTIFNIRSLLLLMTFVFVGYLFLKKKQDTEQNWALFFSALWVGLFLLLINGWSVYIGFWSFNPAEDLTIYISYDLYFIWVIFWGVLLPFFLKGRFIWISTLSLLYLDILVMPILEDYQLLTLHSNWLWGELLLILIVYLPAHYWVYLFLEKKGLKWRSLFQFSCMAVIYLFGLPFIVHLYFPTAITLEGWPSPYLLQLSFILLLPSLIAVIDLVQKGKGTPFPYDPTKNLVQTGVYAYIRNPIQWSLTVLFIPLAIFFNSYYLLLGVIVSVAYTIGVSAPQERASMQERFSTQWKKYKKNVPIWYFSWQPIYIPEGAIYFKKDCTSCSQMRRWLERRAPIHLTFKLASDFDDKTLLQVTYLSNNGQVYTSVKAIAHAFEHINLAWASLGWFMRLPGVSHFLQLIIDSMGLNDTPEECPLE